MFKKRKGNVTVSKYKSKYFNADHVYFVQRANSDVKIGFASKFPNRISQLRSKHGELAILGLTAGDESLEQELHDAFSVDRIYVSTARHSGRVVPTDWFRASPALLNWIKQNTQPYECPTGYHNEAVQRNQVNGAHRRKSVAALASPAA